MFLRKNKRINKNGMQIIAAGHLKLDLLIVISEEMKKQLKHI